MKHTEERRQSILQLLRTSKKLSIEQAMSALDVSESTVRRLFAQLEAEGLAIRTYGGICFNDAVSGALCIQLVFRVHSDWCKRYLAE